MAWVILLFLIHESPVTAVPCRALQDRALRERGVIGFSAEVAAEARAHSTTTAESAYMAQGHRSRIASYAASFRTGLVSALPLKADR